MDMASSSSGIGVEISMAFIGVHVWID
jgi:hypothetical protein